MADVMDLVYIAGAVLNLAEIILKLYELFWASK